MTFAELLADPHRRGSCGTCRFCGGYNKSGCHYGVRHFVCLGCAEARRNDVMPSVLSAERKARNWAREHGSAGARLISHISGVSLEYAEWAISNMAAAP